MKESLLIRLSRDPQQTVDWIVWSSSQSAVIASGQLSNRASLNTLVDYQQDRRVWILLSAGDVSFQSVNLPKGAKRQLQKVLPYLLEDNLAQDIDNVHLHVLGVEQDTAHVVAVDHAWMDTWLLECQSAGLNVSGCGIDALSLPHEKDQLSAVELDSGWLIRYSAFGGALIGSTWLNTWLSSFPESTIQHYSPAPENRVGNWQAQPPELVMALLACGVNEKQNLLSGSYQKQNPWKSQMLLWRKVGLAGLVLTMIGVAHWGWQVRQADQLAQSYRMESERIFRLVLPQYKSIPTQTYLKRQMRDELIKLGTPEESVGFLQWLTKIEPILKGFSDVDYQQLRFDAPREELRLQASARSFDQFEQLRTRLASEFVVQQGQVTRKKNNVTGIFVLKEKNG